MCCTGDGVLGYDEQITSLEECRVHIGENLVTEARVLE